MCDTIVQPLANCLSPLTVSKSIGAGETTYFRETLPTTSGVSATAGVNRAIYSVAVLFLYRVMHTMGPVSRDSSKLVRRLPTP